MKKSSEEMIEIVAKAQRTGKMANTLAKALAKRFSYRWQFVDFRGPNGEESAGIVDIVAIRKSGKVPQVSGLKRLDLFDIILIQVKGGGAKSPTADDIKRLQIVGREYNALGIVLFEWKEKQIAVFKELDGKGTWKNTTAFQLFGKSAKSK